MFLEADEGAGTERAGYPFTASLPPPIHISVIQKCGQVSGPDEYTLVCLGKPGGQDLTLPHCSVVTGLRKDKGADPCTYYEDAGFTFRTPLDIPKAL